MRGAIVSIARLGKGDSPYAKIARLLHSVTGFPVYDSNIFKGDTAYHVLFVINGPLTRCKHEKAISRGFEKARRLIWVQNDRLLSPPKKNDSLNNPFYTGYYRRNRNGLPPMEYWTSVASNAHLGHYVNWNALGYYDALPEFKIREYRMSTPRELFYYGGLRMDRLQAFDKYFVHDNNYHVTISTSNIAFFRRYPQAIILKPIKDGTLMRMLSQRGLGIYISDSHTNAEPGDPDIRFYEMLAAGLPMVFQSEAAGKLRSAGFQVDRYVVENLQDIRGAMWHREDIWREQRVLWTRQYALDLLKQVAKLFSEL